ncbi:MAG: 5'-nucleotidase C-terminal domain-containing protein [Lachnospiraceae bacterium]|nr:5'-nucleotidase C-terminal domain-containing protein [Lachnospiraceae bacterium]
MSETKHLVLLHSNDIHGDFAETDRDGVKTGGLARLSGFVHQTRRREDEVIYAIAGDMFMGSIIDREYRGLSTIKLANALEPDVFEVGNHEVDYGLSHLLFLEKCADFPIICANMYVKELNRRLFLAFQDVVRAGIRIRFIGLLTESIADRIRQEELVDSAVSIRPVRRELDKVFAETAEDPADITILLTHIGIEEDKLLAAAMDPSWPVDFIIGGHSHTFLQEPVVVGGVPIVQAGFGSGQIGRLDLFWDPDKKRLADWSWELQTVNEETCEEDPLVSFYHDRFQTETDRKYDQVLFSMPCAYTHPGFHRETQLGDFFADIYQEIFHTDVFFLSTNVIWAKTLGPDVTRRDLMIAFPYENAVYELKMTGERFLALIRHVYRREAWEGTNIFFLFSKNLTVTVRAGDREVLDVKLSGADPEPDREYTVGVTAYAYKNRELFLGITAAEEETIRIRRLSVDDRQDMTAFFSGAGVIPLENEGRLRIQ